MNTLLDLDELRTFALVVELGSLSAVARHLRVTTNAVSRRIMRLEESSGVRMFHRSTRAVSVTAEGRQLYTHVRRVLAELTLAEESLRSGRDVVEGRIRLAIPGGLCGLPILQGIAEFVEAHPQLHLDITVVNHPVDPIKSGFDIVVAVGALPDSHLATRRLHTLAWGLAAAPRYLERRKAPKVPHDLATHLCLRIQSNPPQDQWTLIDAQGNTETVPVTGNFESDDSRVLAEATYAGLGIGIRPERELAAAEKAGTLIRVLPRYCFGSYDLHAVMPTGTRRLKRAALLLDFLQTLFRREM